MQLIHVLFDANMQYETLTQKYKHDICFHHKRKGTMYISLACANACLPLFAEESRGCNVLEMQTAQHVFRATGPADKNNHLAVYPK